MIYVKRINIICLIIILLQTAINIIFWWWKGEFIIDRPFNTVLIIASVIAIILSLYLLYKGENNMLVEAKDKI